MAVIVNKDEDKNDALSRRINADLREKVQKTPRDDEDPDLVEDADYMKDLKKTSKFGWVWIVLIVLAIISIISIVFW